jgi:hypothetical protein
MMAAFSSRRNSHQMRNDLAINQRLMEAGYIVIRFHHKEDWLAIVHKHPDVFGVPNP